MRPLMRHFGPLLLFLGCATAAPPPENDWTTVYRGTGAVATSITNASDSPVFLKIRVEERRAVVAQVRLQARERETVYLPVGQFGTVLMISAEGRPRYYRGPGVDVPPNAAALDLTLTLAMTSNLTEIDAREFQ